MKIYNTLTLKKEEFTPIEKNKIRMYVCGPTVYDLIHIGNARPMIVFDVFRRFMEFCGYEVIYVSNFTDIDDKIINRANEEKIDASDVAKKYIKEAIIDMESIGVKMPTFTPKATEEIDGMIKLISDLIDKGHAYKVDDGTVYFDVSSFKEYGKLSHKNLDELIEGVRDIKVSGKDQKKNFNDFVLWKPAKEGEPKWSSPFCEGRPGWHTECCVMAPKYCGGSLDIHAGGEDLIFPHHENEIAQYESNTGKTFANYWMHNAFLRINNEKMSKSLGNFKTVREIISKYDGNIFRLFMLSTHYRSPLNFSIDSDGTKSPELESAKAIYQRVCTCVERLLEILDIDAPILDDPKEQIRLYDVSKSIEDTFINDSKKDIAEAFNSLKGFREQFIDKLNDDLNTADALTAIYEIVNIANRFIKKHDEEKFVCDELFKYMLYLLLIFNKVMGINVVNKKEDLDSEIEDLINARNEAKKNKDYKRADEIRAELLNKGIAIEDTREGVKWKRV